VILRHNRSRKSRLKASVIADRCDLVQLRSADQEIPWRSPSAIDAELDIRLDQSHAARNPRKTADSSECP
jgi:hypothetical protein